MGGNQFVGMGGGQALPPPMGHSMPGSLPPVNQASMHMMDPGVPAAHMIGSQAPSAADFANMMHSSAPVMQQAWPQQAIMQQPSHYQQQKNSTWSWLKEEGKIPAMVALVIFVMTLPAVGVLFAHYAPSLLKPGGDLNTLGMATRAALGGVAFWVLQRVVAPLLSL